MATEKARSTALEDFYNKAAQDERDKGRTMAEFGNLTPDEKLGWARKLAGDNATEEAAVRIAVDNGLNPPLSAAERSRLEAEEFKNSVPPYVEPTVDERNEALRQLVQERVDENRAIGTMAEAKAWRAAHVHPSFAHNDPRNAHNDPRNAHNDPRGNYRVDGSYNPGLSNAVAPKPVVRNSTTTEDAARKKAAIDAANLKK